MAEELPSVYEESLQMIAPSIVPYSAQSPFRWLFKEKVPVLTYEDLQREIQRIEDLQREIQRIEDLQRKIQRIEDLQPEIQRVVNDDLSRILSSHSTSEFSRAGASDMFGVAMSGTLAFGAGYIWHPKAQIVASQARYFLAPTDVFVCSMLAAPFLAMMSQRFLILKECPAICLMFASSSIAHIILQCPGGLAWIVYLPSAIVAFVFVIPDRVHRFLFNGLGAIITRLMGWINGTSSIIASCAMAIHESFAGIRHEELMIGIVVFVAGYITTQTGQKALDIATQQAWYFLAPTNVFAFFMLASLFFALKSRSFPRLEEYSAVCMTFASSSIARIILQCPGGLAWIVYLPSAIIAFVFVIPDRVHRFLFNGLGAIITRLMRWINGTSSIIASCAMAIHRRFAGIRRHEELPIDMKKENMLNGGGNDMLAIAGMGGIVAIAAAYITTTTGQKALDIAQQQAWYFLAPTNVIDFSLQLAFISFAMMSKRFPRLEKYSAVWLTFACSSIARTFLHCAGGLAWIVYVHSAIVAFVFVIPDRVHRFLFNGLGAIITRLMGWINGTSLIIASCAMAIHERFAGIRHEELPK